MSCPSNGRELVRGANRCVCGGVLAYTVIAEREMDVLARFDACEACGEREHVWGWPFADAAGGVYEAIVTPADIERGAQP